MMSCSDTNIVSAENQSAIEVLSLFSIILTRLSTLSAEALIIAKEANILNITARWG